MCDEVRSCFMRARHCSITMLTRCFNRALEMPHEVRPKNFRVKYIHDGHDQLI